MFEYIYGFQIFGVDLEVELHIKLIIIKVLFFLEKIRSMCSNTSTQNHKNGSISIRARDKSILNKLNDKWW